MPRIRPLLAPLFIPLAILLVEPNPATAVVCHAPVATNVMFRSS